MTRLPWRREQTRHASKDGIPNLLLFFIRIHLCRCYLPGCFSEIRWIQKGFLGLFSLFLFFLSFSLFFSFFFFFLPFLFAFHIAFQSSFSVFAWPDGTIKSPLKSVEQNYRWYHFQLKKEHNSTVDSTQMSVAADHGKLQFGVLSPFIELTPCGAWV